MGYLTDIKQPDQSEFIYDINDEKINIIKPQLKKQNQIYYSNNVGEYIHDAITNAKYPWKVGSLNEHRFFKVTNTLSDYNNTNDSYSGGSTRYAYYENPEAYMNHRNIELEQDIIDNWYKRVKILYPEIYK